MTELAYLVAFGVFVAAGWALWKNYGEWAVLTFVGGTAALVAVFELVFRRKQPRKGTNVPVLGNEQQRKDLAEALKSGQQHLDEAKKDGTAAVQAELKASREAREGEEDV